MMFNQVNPKNRGIDLLAFEFYESSNLQTHNGHWRLVFWTQVDNDDTLKHMAMSFNRYLYFISIVSVLYLHCICSVFVLYLDCICIVFVLCLLCIDHDNSSVEQCTAIWLIIDDWKIGWLMSMEIGLCQINYAQFAWPRYNRLRNCRVHISTWISNGKMSSVFIIMTFSIIECVFLRTEKMQTPHTHIVLMSSSSGIKDMLFQSLLFKVGFITELAVKRCLISVI